MKQVLAAAMVTVILLMAGCGGGSSPSSAPAGVKVVAGDSSATVSWTQDSSVGYWIWVAQGPGVTTQNCSTTSACKTYEGVSSPFIVSGLANGTTYSVTVNGHNGKSPGGPGSDAIAFVPRLAGSAWKAGNSLGPNNLLGSAFTLTTTVGGSAVLAVGAGGTIFSSPDALTWSARTSGVTANLNAAHYANGLFVAAGDAGTMLTSPDAITWTSRASQTTNKLYALVGNGSGVEVAVGAKGTIIGSSNDVDWVARDSGTTNDLYGIAFGNGRYVAVGAHGTLLTSNGDGTWTTITPATSADLRGVTYGSTAATATTPAVATFVAVGAAGALLTSADGLSWTAQSPIASNNLAAVVYGTQFVAVGSSGGIFTSADGVTWQPAVSVTTEDLNAVTFTVLAGGSIGVGYAAVGNGGVNLTAF